MTCLKILMMHMDNIITVWLMNALRAYTLIIYFKILFLLEIEKKGKQKKLVTFSFCHKKFLKMVC